MKPIVNNLIIEMHIPNLDQAKAFYSKLGFKIGIDDKPTQDELGYLTMIREDKAGNTMLNFYGGDERVYDQSFFKQFSQETKRGYATGITIVIDDIENFYKQAKSGLGENIVREIKELKDHDHKWKDFRMVDPFGFYLRFTELIDWGQK